MKLPKLLAAVALSLFAGVAPAADTVETRLMTLQLAGDIARVAVEHCAQAGYQVSAVVVDRSGVVQVVMRDVFASRFSMEIAERKANAVVLSGVSSAQFIENRGEIRSEMNEVDGILLLAGALPIRAAGRLLGAVGVSGAPGGDKDEACARAALAEVDERLEFAAD